MALIDEALSSECMILSSAGAHARQDWLTIINRKRRDITKADHTVWVTNSQAAKPEIVQSFCAQSGARHVVFLSKKRDKPGTDTSNDDAATRYSADSRNWSPLHTALTEVTGRITRATTGFWFCDLETIDHGKIDLTPFVKADDGVPLTGFSNISSAYPVRRSSPASIEADGTYEVLAVGRLGTPFAVWLRK